MKMARQQLTLRGLLHFLWERAGFNRWHPRMEGKRSYGALYKFLTQACEHGETKGFPLVERLLIPEPFTLDRAAGIAQRTARHWRDSHRPTRCDSSSS
jgi:Protein of unknown function (DUF1173)